MARDVSELSSHSLYIASLTWFVVVAWADFLNTFINSVAEYIGAQDGWQELVMRLGIASILTLCAIYVYKTEKERENVQARNTRSIFPAFSK